MRATLLILGLVALAAAAPKTINLGFRNLYKPAIVPIEANTNPRIIGGQEAVPNSIPSQAYLEFNGWISGWLCGGSLISVNYVLTAGHCGDGAASVKVVLGAHRPSQSESTQLVVTSTDITVHPGYNGDEIINDIAVIRLLEPVTTTSAIQVIPLPGRADAGNTYEGVTGRVSGWGLTVGQGSISPVLNYVDGQIIANSQCERTFGSLLSSIVCTSGEQHTGACNGDSGGPLIANGVQVGVVSFGLRNCPLGYPSAFSRVTSFLDWLSQNTDVQIV